MKITIVAVIIVLAILILYYTHVTPAIIDWSRNG